MIKYDEWCGCRTLGTGHWTLDSGVSSANGCSAWTHGSAKKRALAPPISLASVLPPSRPLLFLASPFPRPSCLRPLPSRIPTSYPDPLSFPASLQEHLINVVTAVAIGEGSEGYTERQIMREERGDVSRKLIWWLSAGAQCVQCPVWSARASSSASRGWAT